MTFIGRSIFVWWKVFKIGANSLKVWAPLGSPSQCHGRINSRHLNQQHVQQQNFKLFSVPLSSEHIPTSNVKNNRSTSRDPSANLLWASISYIRIPYASTPPIHSDVYIAEHPEIEISDSHINSRWSMIDSGTIFLASTCTMFGEVYCSSAITGNLVLHIPEPHVDDRTGAPLDFWRREERIENFL